MDDFEKGYEAYFGENLYKENESEQWKEGYVKAIEDELNDIFSMNEEEGE